MDFLWFDGRVFRVAFSHSLDIAQAIISVLLIVSGAAIDEHPDLKMLIGGIDISGWQDSAPRVETPCLKVCPVSLAASKPVPAIASDGGAQNP